MTSALTAYTKMGEINKRFNINIRIVYVISKKKPQNQFFSIFPCLVNKKFGCMSVVWESAIGKVIKNSKAEKKHITNKYKLQQF